MVGKDHSINISTSVAISWITLGGFAWLVAEPLLIASVSEAMGEEIQLTVQNEIAPINSAMTALLGASIVRLRKDIAAMEYRRDNPPAGDWSLEDTQELVLLRTDLEATRLALTALR